MNKICADKKAYSGTETGNIDFIIDDFCDGVMVSCSGRMVYANKALGQLLGRSHEDLLGREHHVPASNDEEVLETAFRLPDGTVRVFDVKIKDTEWNGKPAKLFVYRNITERKEIDNRLKREFLTFKMLAEKSLNIMFSLDEKNRFSYISPSIERITGFKQEYVNGDYLNSIVQYKDTDSVDKVIAEVREKRISLTITVALRTFGRSFVKVDLHIHPLAVRNRTAGVYGIISEAC